MTVPADLLDTGLDTYVVGISSIQSDAATGQPTGKTTPHNGWRTITFPQSFPLLQVSAPTTPKSSSLQDATTDLPKGRTVGSPRQQQLSPLPRLQRLQLHRSDREATGPLPRSRSSAPSAPAPKTTGAYPVTESSSRSTQLRPNPQAYPPLILLPNPQSDPWRKKLQVLASQHVRDGIPVNQEQLDYVAATLNAAGIPSQHSTLAYAKVNSDHHYSKITPHWFMLTVPYLGATVRLKEPTKTRPMLLWTHASSIGGTRGILRSRQIHPSSAAQLGVPSLLRPRMEDHRTPRL